MYTFIVMVILLLLGVLAYYLFLKEKSLKLEKVEKGICPECGRDSIEIRRAKSGGCSGTTNVIYYCTLCGYEEEFNIESSCGSGGCGI
ncbi:MAG: hypothetical protein GXO61_02270 [Epsilonproteobacteria bacterium]|nr:hypothetical protein [Campylobacterota bacterium]